jgi:dTDP-4-dehydrorhamnose reductase
MKALITGANGQVGRELQRAKPDNWEIIALSHTELDITNYAEIASVFQKHQPDIAINAAAYTAVDKAESEIDSAYKVNDGGAANIAKAAENSQARLIQISTDFVFDGSKSKPYLPDDNPNPINVYGKSKLRGELAVMSVTKNKALILRTGWVYSSRGKNFVKSMLKLLTEKDYINVIADQVGTPTWGQNLAHAIYNLANLSNVHGIYHWTDAGVASWYDFAIAIQEEAQELGILHHAIPIKPIRTVDYPTPAMRPSYSVLDKTATWQILGYAAMHWRKSLRLMLSEIKDFDYA